MSEVEEQQQHKRKKQPFANLKKRKKEAAALIPPDRGSRRRGKDGKDSLGENEPPNKGSFVRPEMQELFSVQVPKIQDHATGAKRKVALLIAYLGSRYAGFQINPEKHTVQAEIELALYKAQLLNPSNFGFPHKYSWSTSGRTDKGVHANAQVVSCKIEMGDESTDDVRIRINQQLPDDIEVLDVKRTTRNFCAKTFRSGVRYQYMIPSFVFSPEVKNVLEKHVKRNKESIDWKDPLTPDQVQQIRADLLGYKVSPERLSLLRKALEFYVGTHVYHNFTRGMAKGDKSSKRYMLSFTAHDPIVIDDEEWIPTTVHGQAFLLNQIRKMISLAIDVVLGIAVYPDTMEKALSPDVQMKLSIAPAQGLFLDMSDYGNYNSRKANTASTADSLDWINQSVEESPALQRWNNFKQQRTIPKIIEEEREQGNFVKYIYFQMFLFDGKEEYLKSKDNPEVSTDNSPQTPKSA